MYECRRYFENVETRDKGKCGARYFLYLSPCFSSFLKLFTNQVFHNRQSRVYYYIRYIYRHYYLSLLYYRNACRGWEASRDFAKRKDKVSVSKKANVECRGWTLATKCIRADSSKVSLQFVIILTLDKGFRRVGARLSDEATSRRFLTHPAPPFHLSFFRSAREILNLIITLRSALRTIPRESLRIRGY